MPLNKELKSFSDAVSGIFDGATILISGFGGSGGSPQNLIKALRDHGAKYLTIISNTGGLASVIGFGSTKDERPVDIGILVENFEDTLNQASQNYNSNQGGGERCYNLYFPSPNKHVKSLISKNTGKVINIKSIGDPPTKKFLVHFYGDNAITLNDDGTYSLGFSNDDNIKQQFELIYISNVATYTTYIPLENRILGDDGQLAGYDVNKSHKSIMLF